MDPCCHLTELSLPVLLRIIAHLDDASTTQLALGGSCARDAVEAHANVAYVSALHRLEARTGWPDTSSVDMRFVSVSVRAGFTISSHAITALGMGMPIDIVSFAIGSLDLLNATRDPRLAKCVLTAAILQNGGTDRWSHLHATIGDRHAKLCIIYTGGREWSRLMSTATHEEILDLVAAASPAERSRITGPIAQINIGSCNFSNLTEERSAHAVVVSFAPKTAENLMSAQPALEACVWTTRRSRRPVSAMLAPWPTRQIRCRHRGRVCRRR